MDVRTAVSIIAIVLSAASIGITLWNWRRSNRPIVAAVVRTRKAGNSAILYDLVVVNAGNRPATNVRLQCDSDALDRGLATGEDDPLRQDVLACFDSNTTIPFLAHGDAATNSFGKTCRDSDGPTWRHRSRVPVTVRYSDLEGRNYSSKLELVIQDSAGFAGGIWSEPQSEPEPVTS